MTALHKQDPLIIMFLSSWVFDEIQKEPNFNTQALRLGALKRGSTLIYYFIVFENTTESANSLF